MLQVGTELHMLKNTTALMNLQKNLENCIEKSVENKATLPGAVADRDYSVRYNNTILTLYLQVLITIYWNYESYRMTSGGVYGLQNRSYSMFRPMDV